MYLATIAKSRLGQIFQVVLSRALLLLDPFYQPKGRSHSTKCNAIATPNAAKKAPPWAEKYDAKDSMNILLFIKDNTYFFVLI